MVVDVIKRQGKRPSEPFKPTKLHQSIVAVCVCVKTPEGEAERIAQRVTKAVDAWCSTKPTVTSDDLRRQATRHLEKVHNHAAHFYKHHRQIF